MFALSYANLGSADSAFEQLYISSFMQTTLVSISIPQINYHDVISLDSSNGWHWDSDFMQDISVPRDVSM